MWRLFLASLAFVLLACSVEEQRARGASTAMSPPSPAPGTLSATALASGEPACGALHAQLIPPRASLVLIVSDTMRRDVAGAYGGNARTPNFDAFARANLLFERAVSQAPWTKPSIASLFTSRFPSQHGVLDDYHRRDWQDPKWNRADVLPAEFDTMAELFQRKGYRTAAFVSNPWMEERFGFAQGFHVYDDSFSEFDAPGSLVTKAGKKWLAGIASHETFFLYLHYIDAHLPYGVLEAEEIVAARAEIEADERPLREEGRNLVAVLKLADGRKLAAVGVRPSPTLVQMAYRKGVESFDRALGELLEALEAHPGAEQTAVIITSDHGEALFARGYGNHGWTLREEEVAIPLVMRLPGTVPSAGRIDCGVGLVDVLPTLCEYFGLDCPGEVAGRSLLGGIGGSEPRYLVSEGLPGLPTHRAIQNRRFKLHYDPSGPLNSSLERNPILGQRKPYSLFDLESDPQEGLDLLAQVPLSAETRKIARIMARELRQAVVETQPPARTRAEVDPEMRSRLEALGYAEPDSD